MVLESNEPFATVEMRVSVGGQIVCDRTFGGGYQVNFQCFLPGAADSVHLELAGDLPATTTLTVLLESSTPEKRTTCAV